MTDHAAGDVRLRQVVEADLPVFFDQQNDPEALRRARFPARDREAFMAHWSTNILGEPTGLVRAVIADGELTGSIVSWWDGDRRFIGYWFGRAYWGRGIGTRALTLYLREEPIRPLYADPFTGNTASVRLLERCGFGRSGIVRHGDNEHVLLVLHPQPGPVAGPG